MRSDLGWTALQWPALEHVIAEVTSNGFRAEGHLVLAEDGLASVRYDLACDASWQVTRLTVVLSSAAGERTLELTSDGLGHWLADGTRRPDLDGCADVDISQTPLTNTLPIRRLDWSAAAVRDLAVVYVRVPELTAERVQQRYTLISRDTARGDSVYRYESGTFSAELPVDADGFVVDYPGLWQRIRPASRRNYGP